MLAYLLDVRSLLDTALEFKDGSLDMDPFFSRQEFEYGVIALAHALEISIHEAHEFVQHAKAVSGIRRTYVYEATSSYPHPRLPSDKTPSQ
ncbi:MAG TPA: hypothetical protein PK765_02295 [bacterium]|nr:hypothetical protein [bacterium]